MNPVPSPCIRNCCLNEENICLGCFRSLSEITGWQQAEDSLRRIILQSSEKRRQAYRKKYPSTLLENNLPR